MTLIADFLAGSLMTLLIPVGLLVGLVVWYMVWVVKTPEPAESRDAVAPTRPGQSTEVPVADPGPRVAVSDEVNRIPDVR